MPSSQSLAVLIALLPATLCLAQGAFVDDFDAPVLSPRWEWYTPRPGPTADCAANPGHVRLTMPQVNRGFNHWTGENAGDAPLLLTGAPEGDFSVRAHVKLASFGKDSNFHAALVVAFSRRYVVGWGPFYAPSLGNPREAPEVWCEATGEPHLLVRPMDCSDLWLRIDRRGHEYRFSVRDDIEAPWVEAGVWTSAWPPTELGFMGKTFGDGPAVVWDIDSVEVAQAPASELRGLQASIDVDTDAEPWPLSPMRFGHFIEHLGECIYPGIWAEMLRNRKFTGAVSPEGVLEAWAPYGAREGVSRSGDNEIYYSPSQAQRVAIAEGGEPAGIRQDKLRLRPGVAHDLRVVARQEGLAAPLQAALVQGDETLSEATMEIGGDWTVCRVRLDAVGEETEASLVLSTAGPGTLWLGAVSLMPADNVEGMRAEVLRAISEIRPPVLRWPGGNFVSGHDWRDGIGDRDRRPSRWDRAWGAWEWNDFGTDEFIRLCRLVDTVPYICVNCGEGSATEAAAWVEYCNGASDSRFGSLRAENGHPEPYAVPIFSIGNEMWGNWQLGHLNATNYGIKAIEFARAMLAADPSIKLIGNGVDGDAFGGWNKEVCRIAGRQFDWLSVHYYLGLPRDYDDVLSYSMAVGDPARMERTLAYTYDMARQASGKHLPLAFDEWNAVPGRGAYALRDAVFCGLFFNAYNRLGDRVTMANMALLVNVLGVIRADKTRVVRTALHQAFELYAPTAEGSGVPVEVAAPTFHFPGAGALTALDVTASLSEDRRTLYVAVVNRMPTEAVQGDCSLGSFPAREQVQVRSLSADSFMAQNTFETPEQVRIEAETVTLEEALTRSFPPHSVTVLRFSAR
jgi:alpha-N-arabinofuranosidase